MPSNKKIEYRFRVPDHIKELIKGMHPDLKRRVKAALMLILSDPYIGKSLKDEFKGLKSFKVNRFRIIYRLTTRHIIEIIAIGPRKTIYELTYRIVKKEELE